MQNNIVKSRWFCVSSMRFSLNIIKTHRNMLEKRDKNLKKKCYKYLGSMLTNDGRCTCESKSRIAMAKAAFSKKKTLFTRKLELNLRKKLIKCYIWSIALYGAETWILRAADQKYLGSFEMWCWRRMEKISWADHVRN